jgi:class 3 adenylate cyclase
MFCDLAGSTALSARLDPEDMRQVIRVYQDACSGMVARYDGFVAKFMGDGVLAYFGFPRAHEDDAERAIRAGLEIASAVAALETRAGERLRVRVGVATGLVVVGDLFGRGRPRANKTHARFSCGRRSAKRVFGRQPVLPRRAPRRARAAR